MEKRKYSYCKRKKHILFNSLEKVKVFVIINTSDINNIKNIDQKKD